MRTEHTDPREQIEGTKMIFLVVVFTCVVVGKQKEGKKMMVVVTVVTLFCRCQ